MIGYLRLNIDPDGTLRCETGHQPPVGQAAECMVSAHDAPDPDCQCGITIHAEPAHIPAGSTPARVIAAVSPGSVVIPHGDGARTNKVILHGIVGFTPTDLTYLRLTRNYLQYLDEQHPQVRVLPSVDALLAEFPPGSEPPQTQPLPR